MIEQVSEQTSERSNEQPNPETIKQLQEIVAARKQEQTNEQMLSSVLTVLVARMGGRVTVSQDEMQRLFKSLARKGKTITIRTNGSSIVLELLQVAKQQPAQEIDKAAA